MKNLEDYSDGEICTEYQKRKEKNEAKKKEKEQLKEKARTIWLIDNGGEAGNDQCATNYCRIKCMGCDNI